MESVFSIKIKGFNDPLEFVSLWSKSYSYRNEEKYNTHIDEVLNNKESFLKLFEWKNGTGNGISQVKLKGILNYWDKVEVLRELKEKFSWDLFEEEFEPHKKSTIWRIFLLHLINPNKFPIFDQHVNRFYFFQKSGLIEELPTSKIKVYNIYKSEYKHWFSQIQQKYDLSPKKMDESFFTYGKMLKGFKGTPLKIEVE